MATPIRFLFPMMFIALVSLSCEQEPQVQPPPPQATLEVFTFSSNGVEMEGKIVLPASYATNKNLPSIYLIDYQEQHFQVSTDEFQQVLNGVNAIENVDALIVTLADLLDIDANPGPFRTYTQVFKDMAAHVDSTYPNNSSRTFMGKGSEGGVVLLTLLNEHPDSAVFNQFIAHDPPDGFNNVATYQLEHDDVPGYTTTKKLHYSFTSDNNYNNCTFLIGLIETGAFPWLEFESVEYPNHTYENAYPTAFADALRFVLAD